MKDFLYFIRAVVRNSIYLLTSSAVVALITVYEHVRGSSIAAELFLLISAGLLMGAFYKTWLEERQEAIRLESDLSNTRTDLEKERARRPTEEAQAKLLDAQREEIEVRKKARQIEAEHEDRMKFLTAPDRGIRLLVAEKTNRSNSAVVFTADEIASALAATKPEIEEALLILKFRGFAKETALSGRWLIHP